MVAYFFIRVDDETGGESDASIAKNVRTDDSDSGFDSLDYTQQGTSNAKTAVGECLTSVQSPIMLPFDGHSTSVQGGVGLCCRIHSNFIRCSSECLAADSAASECLRHEGEQLVGKRLMMR
ncbi:hypothetical protein KIN20_026415 [Parelaphostrongylus tenuis]|uniref:Uncharacterized protein n=1 Tax=Parelaphostrongylus tenuis TaxID=148309 RepID=A0AAD5WCU7_PARTN|nr:hypothetical protein KIN20_026415 [Parelaphostrongylus tenuis]